MSPIAHLPLAMLLMLLLPATAVAFIAPSVSVRPRIDCARPTTTPPLWTAQERAGQQQVFLDPTLDDDRVTELFAWICRAFAGDGRYDNLMLAMAAIFGTNMDDDSMPKQMAREAMDMLPPPPPRPSPKGADDDVGEARKEPGEDYPLMGRPITLHDREMASMGAMGAAQWTGQFRTRPHALLDVRNMTSVDDWVRTLPRGVRRTLKRAQSAASSNFTVVARPILGGEPAPHSSLPHFRCVVEHEVRVITRMYEQYGYGSVFFDALSEAVSRYVGTTRMTGEIREYRSTTADDGKVIAFAHEVRKGRVIRGQWFYATDEASRNYVWFHSVYDLVRRAIETEDVDVVDLGPSGSDAFSELKERYGFVSVDDWPAVADYSGPFWDHGAGAPSTGGDDGLGALLRAIAGRRSKSS